MDERNNVQKKNRFVISTHSRLILSHLLLHDTPTPLIVFAYIHPYIYIHKLSLAFFAYV